MLDVLRLANYTIVDAAELVCGPGLNVLTGETGAGKSIIVDALNLLLGARGSPAAVRPGAQQAEIEAVFDLQDTPRASALLEAWDLATANQLVLRRVLTAAGKSRAYANGRLVSLATMAELRDVLCDFHGQHEHQSLLRPKEQLVLLDAAAGLGDTARSCGALVEQFTASRTHVDAIREQQRTKTQHHELLREDLERFASVPLEIGAEAAWLHERDRLANADELHRLVAETTTFLDDAPDEAPTASDLFARATRSLRAAAAFDDQLQPHVDSLAAAQETAGDTARDLRSYLAGLEADPKALDSVQERLHTLQRLKRRYGVATEEELIALRDQCAAELAALDNVEHALGDAETQHAALRAQVTETVLALSKARSAAAGKLAKQLIREIRNLGMPGAELQVTVTPRTAPDGELEIDGERVQLLRTGIDRVTIQFSANTGMPLRPLREVASGGELSRVMLALKAAQAGTIPLLVFDEIDAGIGGNVGNAVGDKLVALAEQRQVFCVTHLPQIAARAATHWQVSKQRRRGETVAHVQPVDGDARARELARMFGDDAAPATALEHAQALLSLSR